MGVPSGDNPEVGDDQILITIYNSCLYPYPPSKFDVALKATDTLKTLRETLVEKTGYQPDSFDLTLKTKKLVEEEKTLADLSFPKKVLINMTKKPSAKVRAQ
jgi:hypothetical protein